MSLLAVAGLYRRGQLDHTSMIADVVQDKQKTTLKILKLTPQNLAQAPGRRFNRPSFFYLIGRRIEMYQDESGN